MPTRKNREYARSDNGVIDKNQKYQMLREKSSLKECYIVRYADDFKLFTKNYEQARRLFYAVTGWLIGRLGLDISPEKSKIVNLRKRYSEFLGFRIRAANHGNNQKPKFVVESHVKAKSLDTIAEKMKSYK